MRNLELKNGARISLPRIAEVQRGCKENDVSSEVEIERESFPKKLEILECNKSVVSSCH